MSRPESTEPTASTSATKETDAMTANAKPCLPRRLLGALALCAALAAMALAAAPAAAEFDVENFDVRVANEDGSPATQAGSHPFQVSTSFDISTKAPPPPYEGALLDEQVKDLFVTQPEGFIGKPGATPRCSTVDFLSSSNNITPDCPAAAALGYVGIKLANKFVKGVFFWTTVYNLEATPGLPAALGFWVANVPVQVAVGVEEDYPYSIVARTINPNQLVEFTGADLTLWGVPADPAHDSLRGECISTFFTLSTSPESVGNCPVDVPEDPFLTLPRACQGPLPIAWEADSFAHPGAWISGSVLTHDFAEPPNPIGATGCEKLAYTPQVESKPTADSAESGTGLDFNLDFEDEGLANPDGLAGSDTKKTEVILPEGVTINPSIGEGLGVCTPADYAREKLDTEPGEGCPNSSKIGSLTAETPIVDEALKGSIYLAQQDDPTTTEAGAENPFDSLIALYFVVRNKNLGAIVKLPVKVEPDPNTGQIVTTLDNIPQFPISHFNAHLREGQRAALVTPAACGTYQTEARLYPWADPGHPKTLLADMQITSGRGGGACPPGGVPPFEPGFEAGSLNNNAGSYSEFDMRLIREDGEQDMTKFSSVLPPGVLGKLAGISKCPDSAIAAAKAKTGREELASPSCPANSLIGHTKAGAGVGSALTYVPGQIYLAGPYHGDPLSVVSVTPAVAGPFDAGTVVVRLALNLNPKTAEVEVDGAASDPIPHILKGIVLKVRDLRVYVDRQNFIINPTSCDESSARATLFGSYLNVLDPSDDRPVDLSTRYQAANCLNLGFHPHLGLHLKGGTRRGAYPGLKAVYSPKKGDANIKGLVVRLPRSAFLEQGHIRTICTRVQYAAESCPKAAQYGYIKAWTPLLDEPLQGPVWLRSSNHKLPDMVFDLRGLVNVEVSTRIDSVHGGIRARVEDAPDAPISRVILHMQGGKKGLIVNSRNLCYKPGRNRANVLGLGQNGKQFKERVLMQTRCSEVRKHRRHHRRARRARVARSSATG